MKVLIKLSIFFLSVVVRMALGALFFGSVDVRCLISMTHCTFHHDLLSFPMWNYFPVLPHYLWIVGWLAAAGVCSLSTALKLIPAIFDGFMTLLVYDMVAARYPGRALSAGVLYAFNPVSIFIVALHGQWDALFLFFLIMAFFVRDYYHRTFGSMFLFGVLFACSIFLKPAALIAAPLFFVPYKGFVRESGWLWYVIIGLLVGAGVCAGGGLLIIKMAGLTVEDIFTYGADPTVLTCLATILTIFAGMIAGVFMVVWKHLSGELRRHLVLLGASIIGVVVVSAFCLWRFWVYGFNLIVLCDTILRYCNQGVQVIGLPLLPALPTVIRVMLKNRALLMIAIGAVAYHYYRGRYDAIHALMITFLILFTFTGVCPQYFMWIVPLLCIRARFIEVGWYVGLIGLWYIFFYAHPFGNPVMPFQNMLTFAVSDQFQCIAPSSWVVADWLKDIIFVVGNLVVPVASFILMMMMVRSPRLKSAMYQTNSYWPYCLAAASVTVIAEIIRHGIHNHMLQLFDDVARDPLRGFCITMFEGRPIAAYNGLPIFNIISMLIVFVAVWCMCAFYVGKMDRFHE